MKKLILLFLTIAILSTSSFAATTYFNTTAGNNISIGNSLFVDNSNKRIGIGTVTPSNSLEVNGIVELTNLYDNDGSDFFDESGCGTTATVTAIDSTGAVSCSAISDITCTDCLGDTEIAGLTSTSVNSAADLVCTGCIGATEIGDGLGTAEIDETAIQTRVSGTCSGNTAIQSIAQAGATVGCSSSFLTAEVDGSTSNEIQTLGTSGNTITLTSGGSVTAPYATTSLYVSAPDGDRNAATKLPTTSGHTVRFDFVGAGSTSTGGNYAGLMTYAPWDGTTASTGDASYQLAFGSTAANGGGVPQLNIRKGIDSTWNSWYTIWHSGNDGSGSGLDADTLDTYHGSNYIGKNGNSYYQLDTWLQSTAGHGLYFPSSGAGTHFSPGSVDTYGSFAISGAKGGYYGIEFPDAPYDPTLMFDTNGWGGLYYQGIGGGARWLLYYRYDLNEAYLGASSGNKIWHAGNDGSGSGLDADTLDTLSSGSFLRKDTSDTMSGKLTVSVNSRSAGYSTENIEIYTGDNTPPGIGFHRGGYSAVTIYESGNQLYILPNGGSGSLAWHSTNDGSGSGLDADTIDGINPGDWTSFATGSWSAKSPMTITVDSGDVITAKYTIIGKTMTVSVQLQTFSLGGTGSDTFYVTIPASKTAASTMQSYMHGYFAGNSGGVMKVDAGGTTIQFLKQDLTNYATCTNACWMGGTLTFEIQ